MKKLLAIVISMAMIVAMMPMGVFAVGEKGTEANPYNLEEFNELTDIAGKDVWVNVNIDLDTNNYATIGNYDMGDCLSFDANSNYPQWKEKNGRMLYKTKKAGATIHLTGNIKGEEGYNNGNFVGQHKLSIRVPEASTVIFEGMTITGYFDIGGSYVYLYNTPDGKCSTDQGVSSQVADKARHNYTNAYYSNVEWGQDCIDLFIEKIQFKGCQINGGWFKNGGAAKNVLIDSCTFGTSDGKPSINSKYNNDSNPIWWKNVTCNLTIKDCTFNIARPIKVHEYDGNKIGGMYTGNVSLSLI